MRAAFAVILTLVFPGTGHLLCRRYLRGAVLALLFSAALDVFVGSVFLLPLLASTALPKVAAGVMAAVWVYALIDVTVRLKSLRASDFQKTKDDMLRAAQVAWLKDDYAEAERLLRRILRTDERDVEAWVHLGKILKAQGREKEARTCFRSALNLDGSDPWRWQLLNELGQVEIKAAEPKAS
jgi:cytochrome c-type biogenesis protein CcmH/NrfG